MHVTDFTITRNDDGLDLQIEYAVARFFPGTYREPPSGGEVERLDAYHDGEPITLTDTERTRVEEHIYLTHDYGR